MEGSPRAFKYPSCFDSQPLFPIAMKTIRMLIVEDEPELLSALKGFYRDVFTAKGFTSITIETADSVEEARNLARRAEAHPYDLVSLDVNLGDDSLSGLDVLDTLKRFQSVWMVALLTGVESDVNLDRTMGTETGEKLRRGLRRDAYQRFHAERLLMVEKPSTALSGDEARELLRNRLEQIVLVYIEVSRLRYIFRPIEVISMERVKATKESRNRKGSRRFIKTLSTHWQIRFDCGDIRTLPNKTGFKVLHHILSLDRNDSLAPEAALVIEPKNERAAESKASGGGGDAIAEFFESKGIRWSEMDKLTQDNLIQVLLANRMRRYVELREIKDDEGLLLREEEEMEAIVKELGPLAAIAETGYLRLSGESDSSAGDVPMSLAEMSSNDLHRNSGAYDRHAGGWGEDSPEAQSFRARMMRVKDSLRENGFATFADHLDSYLSSTGGCWSYHPPEGVEWTLF